MYKSFTINNFRCFKKLTLKPLERINLIAGRNNSGKTSFLEALFIHLGPSNPDLPFRVNLFRGIDFFEVEPEELWGPLFYNKDIDGTIEFSSIDKTDGQDTLKLTLTETEESFIAHAPSGTTTASKIEPVIDSLFGARELILNYENGSGRESLARAFITPDGKLKIKQPELKHKKPGVFLPARNRFLGTDANRYSKLDRLGKADLLVDTMKILEPRLKRLAVLVTGGVPIINGDIGLKELIPIPFMGEGMVRLLSILLAIYDVSNGVVLVDEIENGLHHTAMAKVWMAIAIAAQQSNTQIFATTHSWECVVAAHQAFIESDIYDFLYHRFNMVNGKIKAVTYDQRKLNTAITTGLEVR